MKNLKNNEKTKIILKLILLLVLLFGTISIIPTSSGETLTLNKNEILVESIKYKIKVDLIAEVDSFIFTVAPTSKLSGEKLVTICNKYNLDLTFVLAQGLLESHFGTKGIAARTNSVFNVGTFDNGVVLYKYKHPNESIEPYAILLTENYLLNKEIKNLTKDKGYIDKYGRRFATSKRYEYKLRLIIESIEYKTNIKILQQLLKLNDEQLLQCYNI